SIRNKGKVKGAKEALKTAQIALWILTGLHILGLLIIKDPTALVFQFSFTAMFLVAALALKLRPITVLTIVVTILGLFYLFLLVFDRNAFLSGLLWKMLTMITLGYSLYAVITAKKTQEISPYLLQEGEDNLKPKIKPDEDLLDI
ncbi:MAG: hypothetical protein KDC84_11440, partial [Crocinitomicaceae bacterium]|nr:hypothetical protein [Crocinitomicaceae bacterium]